MVVRCYRSSLVIIHHIPQLEGMPGKLEAAKMEFVLDALICLLCSRCRVRRNNERSRGESKCTSEIHMIRSSASKTGQPASQPVYMAQRGQSNLLTCSWYWKNLFSSKVQARIRQREQPGHILASTSFSALFSFLSVPPRNSSRPSRRACRAV